MIGGDLNSNSSQPDYSLLNERNSEALPNRMVLEWILTPILRTWVQKITLLLQNRGHAEVLKKDPFFREIRNAGAAPLCT